MSDPTIVQVKNVLIYIRNQQHTSAAKAFDHEQEGKELRRQETAFKDSGDSLEDLIRKCEKV